jgi:hypothetical protein
VNGVIWLGCGALLAIGLSALTRSMARQRELAVYAVALTLAALIYPALLLLRGSWRSFWVECAGALAFSVFAFVGWRRSAFLLAGGWALHAAWDFWGHAILAGNLMPYWYRWSCTGFDLVVAGYVLGRFFKS